MAVNSVLSAGIEGVKRGVDSAQDAAQRIVASTTTAPSAPSDDRPALAASTSQQGLEPLTQAIVDLKVSEHQVKASSAVIKTADEILGTLVDTSA